MDFKIKIPLTSLQPEQAFKDDLVNVTPKMLSTYGSYFRAAAMATNLPVTVLYTIAMVENTGTHYNPSGSVNVSGSERSVGIMQISPAAFYESLKTEIKKSRLTQASLTMLKKYLPYFQFQLGVSIPPSPSKAVLDMFFTALKNPEFNIFAAAITLRKLLEDTVNLDGTMRLDKAIIKYNIGEYSAPTKTTTFQTGDTTALVSNVNKTTSSYIVKAVGKNGAMYYYAINKIG